MHVFSSRRVYLTAVGAILVAILAAWVFRPRPLSQVTLDVPSYGSLSVPAYPGSVRTRPRHSHVLACDKPPIPPFCSTDLETVRVPAGRASVLAWYQKRMRSLGYTAGDNGGGPHSVIEGFQRPVSSDTQMVVWLESWQQGAQHSVVQIAAMVFPTNIH